MTYTEFRDEMLRLMVLASDLHKDGGVDALQAAEATGMNPPEQWVRDAVLSFEQRGYVREVSRGLDGSIWAMVTAEAREEVDRRRDDQVVDVDRSRPECAKAEEAVDSVMEAMAGTNDMSVPIAEHERLIAEVDAGRRLLKAPRVRLGAIVSVLLKALRYIAKKFVDQAVGLLASAALLAVAALLGFNLLAR